MRASLTGMLDYNSKYFISALLDLNRIAELWIWLRQDDIVFIKEHVYEVPASYYH